MLFRVFPSSITDALNNMGTENPGLSYQDGGSRVVDSIDGRTPDDTENCGTGCFNQTPLSPDSEYDEALAFPDSVTILSIGGENPILVERKDDDADSLQIEEDIPFLSVYKPPIKFKSMQRKVFIPGAEIHVQIIDNERSITTHLLNPNL